MCCLVWQVQPALHCTVCATAGCKTVPYSTTRRCPARRLTVNQPVWNSACRSGVLAPYTNLRRESHRTSGCAADVQAGLAQRGMFNVKLMREHLLPSTPGSRGALHGRHSAPLQCLLRSHAAPAALGSPQQAEGGDVKNGGHRADAHLREAAAASGSAPYGGTSVAIACQPSSGCSSTAVLLRTRCPGRTTGCNTIRLHVESAAPPTMNQPMLPAAQPRGTAR